MIGHKGEQAVTVRALRGAAPYIHMYKGKVFVIKTGGGAFRDGAAMRGFMEQVAILHHLGIRVVLVHGGGPQLDEVTKKLGVETRMVQGRRVTDGGAIDVACMVLNGLINTRLLGLCREFGIDAIGLSGVDAGLVRAHKRPPVDARERRSRGLRHGRRHRRRGRLGHHAAPGRGLPAGGEPALLRRHGSPAQHQRRHGRRGHRRRDGRGEADPDCTGAPGILERLDDPHSLISYTDVAGLRRLREEGAISDGMLPKSSAIEAAIRGGVKRVHVISYAAPDALLAEIFTNEGTGTLVVADTKALSAAEQGARLMSRLWDKGGPLDERVLRYTAGEDHALDNRLVAYDVQASIAHAEALHDCGLLDTPSLAAIREGLIAIGEAHARGEWSVTLELEDGQTALETLLTERVGEAGARLHAGRSRNDQVLAALRLYLRDAVESLAADARRVAEALESLAAEQGKIVLPGYTHMQQAMPSSVALWAGGFAAEILDDADGTAPRASPHPQEPARVGAPATARRTCRIDREADDRARVPGNARAGDGRAALPRQGRGRGCCSRSRS